MGRLDAVKADAAEVPLTTSQRYYFDLSRARPASTDMKIVLAVLIEGHTVDAVADAIRAAVHRHPSLRMRFARRNGSWWQSAAPVNLMPIAIEADRRRAAPALPVAVLQIYEDWYANHGLPPAAAHAAASALIELKRYVFDLTCELPTRVILLTHDDGRISAVIGMHHAAADAYAFAPLLRDVAAFARAPADAGSVDGRFGDYARKQAAQFAACGESQLAYWSDLLRADPHDVDTSYLDSVARPCQVLGASLTPLTAASRLRQAPLLAAFAQALGAQRRLPGSYVLTTTSNRWSAEDGEIVGCLYKHVIWRPPGDLSRPVEVAKDFFAQTLRSVRNVDVTLDMIIARYHRDRGAFPALNTSFSYRDLTPLRVAPTDHDAFTPLPMLAAILEQRTNCQIHVTADEGLVSAAQVSHPDYLPPPQAGALFEMFLSASGAHDGDTARLNIPAPA